MYQESVCNIQTGLGNLGSCRWSCASYSLMLYWSEYGWVTIVGSWHVIKSFWFPWLQIVTLPLPLKHGNKHADKSTWDHGMNVSVMPGIGPSLTVEHAILQTPLLVVPSSLPLSPVTLSQVDDLLATSKMVQALHAWHVPLVESLSPPPMAVDEAPVPPPSWELTPFNSWTMTHPPPLHCASEKKWRTWISTVLANGVPPDALVLYLALQLQVGLLLALVDRLCWVTLGLWCGSPPFPFPLPFFCASPLPFCLPSTAAGQQALALVDP